MYRAMFSDDFEKPICGVKQGQLGVRVGIDAVPDANGDVDRETDGMSGFRKMKYMPFHLRPTDTPGGHNKHLPIFSIRKDDVPTSLWYRISKSRRKASIRPAAKMSLDDYQTKLCDTGQHWVMEWNP